MEQHASSEPLIVPIFWEDERPAWDWFLVQWILVERYLKGNL
jgi:hypothetical protein